MEPLDLVKGRRVIVLMKFGSHLYGLNTPKSDTDYKGIFLPTAEEILLQKIPPSINYTPEKTGQGVKNSATDVDIEFYSLNYFIALCLKGETVAIDMLHANKPNIIQCTTLWDYIQSERGRFYTKNLGALVSYCRKQAAKYSIKGSRLHSTELVINYLKEELDK